MQIVSRSPAALGLSAPGRSGSLDASAVRISSSFSPTDRALLVRVLDRSRRVAERLEGLVERDPAPRAPAAPRRFDLGRGGRARHGMEPLVERLPGDELHGEVVLPLELARLVDRDDARVLQ